MHMHYDPEEIESVSITWSEYGYKNITVELKNGEIYIVESD